MNTAPTPSDQSPAPSKRLTKEKLYAVAGVVAVLLLSGPSLVTEIKGWRESFQKSKKLNQYKDQIETCVERKTAEANGTRIIGLDLSCAIDIAATFYSQDPDLAIDLCMKYNFIAPKGDPKDAYVRSLTTLHRATCKSNIKERLSGTNEDQT